jgi:hypothetical protein
MILTIVVIHYYVARVGVDPPQTPDPSKSEGVFVLDCTPHPTEALVTQQARNLSWQIDGSLWEGKSRSKSAGLPLVC